MCQTFTYSFTISFVPLIHIDCGTHRSFNSFHPTGQLAQCLPSSRGPFGEHCTQAMRARSLKLLVLGKTSRYVSFTGPAVCSSFVCSFKSLSIQFVFRHPYLVISRVCRVYLSIKPSIWRTAAAVVDLERN